MIIDNKKVYHAKCNKCGKVFNEGFVIDEGQSYYCSEMCLKSKMSMLEYSEKDEDFNYYTEWTEPDDAIYWENGEIIDR